MLGKPGLKHSKQAIKLEKYNSETLQAKQIKGVTEIMTGHGTLRKHLYRI